MPTFLPLAAVNPELLNFVGLGFIIIFLGSMLRLIHQPYIIAYIIAGILMGEHGFGIITDQQLIDNLGELGLILLLFFIGMETSLPDLIKKWKVATIGTTTQILLSIGVVALISMIYSLQWSQVIVLGMVISLSSSAVIIKLLQDNSEMDSTTGRNVISVLLMQDILIVPMLIATQYLGGNVPNTQQIVMQLIGGVLIMAVIIWIIKKKKIRLPFSEQIKDDHELQVFIALIFCFGGAVLTAFFGLSAALGAFVGGLLIHAAQSTEWFHNSLHSFRVMFVAIFFVSVGMMIDLTFFQEHWQLICWLLLGVYLTNHVINTVALHYFGCNWRDSVYGGALLAQIGELSFILAASAYQNQIISDFSYQVSILVIALTLLISPFWIIGTKRIIAIE